MRVFFTNGLWKCCSFNANESQRDKEKINICFSFNDPVRFLSAVTLPLALPSDIHANRVVRNEQLSLKLNIDLPENFLISLHLHF